MESLYGLIANLFYCLIFCGLVTMIGKTIIDIYDAE